MTLHFCRVTLTLTLQLTGWLWSLWGWSSRGCDLSNDLSDLSTGSAGHLTPAVLSWAKPQSSWLVATTAPTSAFKLSQQVGVGRDFLQLQAGRFLPPRFRTGPPEVQACFPGELDPGQPRPSTEPAQCVSTRETTQGGQLLLGQELNLALWGEGTPQASSPRRS